MSHCQRGDEAIVGMEAHSYRYEAGGLAVLGSIQPQAVLNRPDGTMDLAEVEAVIKPDDPHFARTRLLALENTITGRVLSRDYLGRRSTWRKEGAWRRIRRRARVQRRHRARHEGERSARASTRCPPAFQRPRRAGGHGASAQGFIDKAKRARKILGGMRQAGVIAAAGLYALENNVARLADDHRNAEKLARGLRELGLEAQLSTNMVLLKIAPEKAAPLQAHMKAQGARAAASADAPRHAPRRRCKRHRARARRVQVFLRS